MLTVLVGTDTKARAKRLEALLVLAQKGGAETRAYSDVSFDAAALRELSGSASLFGGTFAVVVAGIGDVADKRDEFEKLIPALVDSEHRFILSENALLAPFLKKVTAKKGVIEEFSAPAKAKKAEAFNMFALTDAFGDRNRSLTWALYRKAIETGADARELHGKIFWAVKAMLAARSAKTAGESGLNPFVYQKAKAGSMRFRDGELERIAIELTTMFHEALVSGIDMETALESFILKVLAK
jgi:hypothetical protein